MPKMMRVIELNHSRIQRKSFDGFFHENVEGGTVISSTISQRGNKVANDK